MNKLFCFIIILSIPISLFSQKIRSLKEFTYRVEKNHGEYNYGKVTWENWWGQQINFYAEFDKDSNLIESRKYYAAKKDDDTNYSYSFTKTEFSGKKPFRKINGYVKNKVDTDLYEYIFIEYGPNNYSSIIHYEKDKKTLRQKVIQRTADTSNNVWFTEEYTRNNRLKERTVHIHDSVKHTTYIFMYDSLNSLLEYYKTIITPEPNGNSKIYSYSYAAIGRPIPGAKDTALLTEKGPYSYTETEAKKDGQVITRYHVGGLLKEVEEYTYNEKGDMATYKRHAKSPSEPLPRDYPTLNYMYQYKYDQYGNWTEKEVIDIEKNKPLFFVKRTITYY